ncbi:Zinc finger CCCH domain-containing protein 44 [Sesamum alatum]|uniref:Zinc finger CCCH domain-containing protein 44 n=1 Tax=Sesamum alatum TaxID=300844 RepID=A0AAE1YI25_9LAMI|nr:Zinc finger CCCH domain-containing protein 44 [Sesamum alatum]
MENIETLLAAVAQTQGFDDDDPDVSTGPTPRLENSVSSPEIPGKVSESQLLGAPLEVSGDARPSAAPNLPPAAVGQVIGAVEKRKRGRPPKGQLAAKPPPAKRNKQEEEEEDVCFICFDGGSLVLCDRKGCPKAYHPACIKRDEAFFKSKAKWNCGWHICSVCRKASHYMCYTCTYSLCKGCTKNEDYVSVRGNKGFCTTCMKTIMLIENKDQANDDSVQVDFDDQTSWEYLFKMYWVLLKEKLSLTINELIKAKKPWKSVPPVVCNPHLSNVHDTAVDGKVSIPNRTSELLELNKLKEEISVPQNHRFNTAESSIDNHIEKLNSNKGEDGPNHRKEPKNDNTTYEPSIEGTGEPGINKATDKPVKDGDNPSIAKDTDEQKDRDPYNSGSRNHTEWASKALLEFVALMKNGDTSPISQFDAQLLLLDYIERNNLEDPIQKSQIICDLRLKNLFGKPRFDHTEMLKLLESHFLIKEDTEKNPVLPAGFVSSTDMEVDGNNFDQLTQINSEKQRATKRSEERAPQRNLSEYAAIDVHNINLIYLRRNLMENLIEDKENFHDKVVGSIVRINISSDDQKPDIYRLVQVVGTIKVAAPYKVGDRTADLMLEVLNLDRKEIVSIAAISNQEFTEGECRQLHQSIRCGLLKQFTLGELQTKAMALQSVKLNDWLEAEILRLNHLRDQSSDRGRNDEYPFFSFIALSKHMPHDLAHFACSLTCITLREYAAKLQLLKSPKESQRPISCVPEIHADPEFSVNYDSENTRSADNGKKDENLRPRYSGSPQNGKKPMSPDQKRREEGSTQTENRIAKDINASGPDSMEKHLNQVNITNSATGGKNAEAMLRSEMQTSTAADSVGKTLATNNIETEKLWHYRDPNGKIQGPFSMMHLRQWSTTGLFPPDMRIWTNHELFDSLLLTHALNGKFHGASELPHNRSSESQEHSATGGSKTIDQNDGDSKLTDAACGNNLSVSSNNNSVPVRADEPSWPQCWDLLKDNNSSADNIPAHSSLPSSRPGQMFVALPDRVQESDNFNRGQENTEKKSSGATQNETTGGHGLHNKTNNQNQAVQSSEEKLRSLPIDLSLNDIESSSIFEPVSKLPDSVKQDGILDVSDLLSPRRTGGIQATGKQQSSSSNVPTQDSVILGLLSPAPRSNNEEQGDQASETKQSRLLNFPVPNSGPSWGSASNLVVGGVRFPEVADEMVFPYNGKTFGAGIGFVILALHHLLKPPEVTNDNVGTSDSFQLTHVSPSHPTSNIPNWLAMINEPIELMPWVRNQYQICWPEVDAMESTRGLGLHLLQP